jgi:hypothetical protein
MYYGANTQQEDDELERALAASREEAGLPPQQSGTINPTVNVNEVHFGPATQGEYEREKWAMVPSSKINIQEILPDPEPSERKRDIDVPALLKPGVTEHRLAGLLTMYHAIPATRELFVDREVVVGSYGSDADWWSGASAIKLESHGLEPGAPHEGEVRLELQRIMAFLDKTDRSYGSVESLTKMGKVKHIQRNVANCREPESAVLEAWNRENASRPNLVGKIFSHGVSSETRKDRDEEIFAILDLTLPPKDSYMETIYDIADDLLWKDFGPSTSAESAYLEHVSDVFVFKLSKESSDTKALDFPVVWYPNRYMLENRETALEMRMRKREAWQDIERIAIVEEKLNTFQARNGKEYGVRELLKTGMRCDEARIEEESDGEDVEIVGERSGRTSGLAEKLQKVLDSIDRKLEGMSLYSLLLRHTDIF